MKVQPAVLLFFIVGHHVNQAISLEVMKVDSVGTMIVRVGLNHVASPTAFSRLADVLFSCVLPKQCVARRQENQNTVDEFQIGSPGQDVIYEC
jgi:hypothetical protein